MSTQNEPFPMTFSRQLKRHFCNIPLQLVMVVPFVVQIVVSVGLVGYLSYRSGQDSVNQLATELRKQTVNQVGQFLNSYLATPVLINRINADAMKAGQISFQDIPKLEKHLYRQLQQFNNVSRILVGTERGDLRIVNRDPLPSLWMSDPLERSRVREYSVDRDGNKLEIKQTIENFQLQMRPWYQAAVRAHKPLRVPIFAISDNSDFSFNSSHPIYAPETGQLLGVFSATSDLSFVHKFMTGLEIGKTGRVFIVERNGLLVGDSTKALPFVKIQKDGKTILQRLKATDSSDRLIQLASTYLSNKFNRLENGLEQIQTTLQLEFWEGSDRHFLEVVPYKDDLGLDWLIVVVVPESDFMFKVQDNIYWTFFLCGMTLILSIGLGILVARWISQPILRLSLASDALAQGVWQAPVPANSAIAEIKALSQSFNQMSAQVQQSFDRVEVALKESQEKYKVLYQILPIGISITDKEGRIIESNIISERFLGSPNLVKSTCQQSEINPNIICPDGSPMPIEEYACFKALRSQSSVYDVEMGIVCIDGILRWFSVSAIPIHLAQYGVVIVLVDISDRKRAEAQLRENEARFQKISNTSPEAIYILISHIDGSTNFEYASKASEELLGVSVEYLKSRTNIHYELFHPDDLASYERAMADSLKTLQPFCHEWRIITPHGQIKWIKSQACPEQRDNGDVAWYGFAIDISDRKKSEITLALAESSLRQANQELERLVNLDGLTQIANRRCFNERIVHEWQRLHREQQPLSLLMFDVDYFKRYNDHYGHQMGDTCLVKIAQAVNHLMCRPADLVARYGGEEFIVILPNTDLDGAIAVADRIHIEIQNLQIPHQYSDVSNIVSVSLGIACDIPNIERSPYVLINQSDRALYYAKQKGRNQSVIFAD